MSTKGRATKALRRIDHLHRNGFSFGDVNGLVGRIGSLVEWPTSFAANWPGPAFDVYSQAGSYSASLSAKDYANESPAKTYYVAPWGSTGNSGLTHLLPKANISQVISALGTQPTAGVRILLAAGFYSDPGNNVVLTVPVDVICPSGRAVIASNGVSGLSATADSGIYKWTSVTNLAGIVDWRFLSAWGRPFRLTAAGSLAACQSTAGTYYNDGADTYVNLLDGRVPDSSVVGYDHVGTRVLRWQKGGYIQNCDFHGFANSITMTQASPYASTDSVALCNVRLVSSGSVAYNGLYAAMDRGVVVIENSATYYCGKDGWNFTQSDSYVNACAVLINSIAEWSGVDYVGSGGGALNANTQHYGWQTVDVGGANIYAGNRVIADINTAKRWMIGAEIGWAAGNGTDWSTQGNTAFALSDTAQIWLDDCRLSMGSDSLAANTYQIYWVDPTATLRYRNMSVSGWRQAAATTNGTLEAY